MTPLGYVSRYDLAIYIFELAINKKIISSKTKKDIVPNSTIYIKNNVNYPLNCSLNSSKLINFLPFEIKKWDFYFNITAKKYFKEK